MQAEMRSMTSAEVAQAVQDGRVPVIPIATLETHDPHLPVDTDVVLVEEVVRRASDARADLLLRLPVIPFGFTEHTMDFPGGITIRPQVLLEYYFDVAESLAENGFRRIMFVNGHGSNANIMQLAARLATLRTPALVAATSWWELAAPVAAEIRESEFPGGMAHACELETSAYLAIDPDAVRMDAAEDCMSSLLDEWTWADLYGSGPIHFVPWWSQESANGTEGRPSLATAEKGETVLSAAADRLIAFAEHFRTLELPPKNDRRPADLRWIPGRR